ncbi:TonB-dependent receptor family protein [Alkalilimnicola ehrlichii MLHE-1]|uniref:TonB-dependent receptor n=1 Tax=Alkalilimnicola ehrlichii (strain ATCC BAA-1101 / DSM 17681 / MLHE-1) TaxID=187272 RepID=Q0A523_ALKEH|nr:TonB-dependent receptor plug domain-containing protein [Alkalilimnicola ehrlichii]ABI58064.1 TonB-dependent receptor [Alkalilimnicola ehrlichii MLHE-1]
MDRKTHSLICLTAGLSLLPAAGAALAEDETAGAVRALQPLQVRALLLDEVADTPGAASVLTDLDFEALRPFTLHDAFDFVAGVRTIDDDALGLRSGIGVRGAPPRRSRKTLLLEDGSPISASNYLDPSAHYTPPMQRLERVEVLKGAGQLIHGPLNNHGIVNFRNKQATPTPETTVELAGGNQGTFKRHLMHRRTVDDVGVVLAYTGANSDGVFDTEEHQFDDFYASFDWDVNARHDLRTSILHFRERSDGYDESNLSPEDFAIDPRGKRRLGEGRKDNNISVNYWKWDLTHAFQASDRLSFSSKVFYSDLDRPRFRSRNPDDPRAERVMEGRDRRYEVFGGESRAAFTGMQTGAVTHTVEGGLRFEQHDFDDRRPVGRPGERLDEGNRGRLRAIAGEDGFTRDGRLITYKAEAYSGFLQNRMQAGDWTLTPGLRVESYRQEKSTRFRPGSDDEGVTESEWNTLYLPGISLLYQGLDQADLYAGVHRGYAPAPARSDEFPLVPEKGLNSQLGVRSRGLQGVSYDVAVFYNRIEDTLIRDDVDEFGDALFVNAVDSDVYGLDVELRVDSAPFTGSDYNFFGQVAWNYTEAEFTTGPLDGNRVPEIPRHAGSLTLGMDHLSGWEVSATVSHFGDFFSDIENTLEIAEDAGQVPSRTLLSARASYHTQVSGADATLWLQGRNLTDKLYISDVQDGLRPGAERTVIGGLTLRF